jgi:hypothetical protein
VLDLARDPSGVTRLVTTNFDLLFSRPVILRSNAGHHRIYPTLADRVISMESSTSTAVLPRPMTAPMTTSSSSSADFGRAYLAEGWATQFIRAVLGRNKLVFLGYAPPTTLQTPSMY